MKTLAPPGNVTIARTLDEEPLKRLTDGGRVLLLPKLDTLTNSSADLLHWEKLGKIMSFRPDGWDRWQVDGGIALCDPT